MSSKHSAAFTAGSGKPRLIVQIRDAIHVRHYSYRTERELLGHSSVKTTQIYTHVLNRGGSAVLSPLDSGVTVVNPWS